MTKKAILNEKLMSMVKVAIEGLNKGEWLNN